MDTHFHLLIFFLLFCLSAAFSTYFACNVKLRICVTYCFNYMFQICSLKIPISPLFLPFNYPCFSNWDFLSSNFLSVDLLILVSLPWQSRHLLRLDMYKWLWSKMQHFQSVLMVWCLMSPIFSLCITIELYDKLKEEIMREGEMDGKVLLCSLDSLGTWSL